MVLQVPGRRVDIPAPTTWPFAPEPMPLRPRILLVDDEAVVRDTLAPYLETQLQVELRTAASGEEALERLGSEAFHIVIADHAMPGMTGAALLGRVRQEFPHVARVMVTGHREAAVRAVFEEAGGVHAFVFKPYSLHRMVDLLRHMLEDPAPGLARECYR